MPLSTFLLGQFAATAQNYHERHGWHCEVLCQRVFGYKHDIRKYRQLLGVPEIAILVKTYLKKTFRKAQAVILSMFFSSVVFLTKLRNISVKNAIDNKRYSYYGFYKKRRVIPKMFIKECYFIKRVIKCPLS